MQTIFEALRKDHDKQRNLIEALLKTSGDSEDRRSLFKELVHELEEHAKYEERYFYEPLISNDMTQEMSRHGMAEHQEIDKIVEDLQNTENGSTGWLTRFKTLKEKVFHHLKDEEQGFFQLAGRAFSETDKTKLAQQYSQNMQGARQELGL